VRLGRQPLPASDEVFRAEGGRLDEAVSVLGRVSAGLRELASVVRYIGPLREEPRVLYGSGQAFRHLPVGIHGELTADTLARRKNEVIDYVGPDGRQRRAPLEDAVSVWVNYLGIGTDVTVVDHGKLGRAVHVSVGGKQRDLTMIGVGASQLLPVVVAVLGTEPGTLMLLEQPELHLHPAVQSRLADFLLFARPDIRVVVETHSEYLVNRVRLQVVDQKYDAADISILFAEQMDGVTQFRRLEVSELGDLSDWPPGFFDTSDVEGAAIVEAIRKRLAQRKA
jgi:predicted ATPase